MAGSHTRRAYVVWTAHCSGRSGLGRSCFCAVSLIRFVRSCGFCGKIQDHGYREQVSPESGSLLALDSPKQHLMKMMRLGLLFWLLVANVVTNSCSAFSVASRLLRNHPSGATRPAAQGARSPAKPARLLVYGQSYDLPLKATQSATSDAVRNERPSRFPRFLRRVLLLPIDLLGRFVAAVLARAINHPSVRTALGACIVSGVQQLCEDPNLDDYVDRATATINEDLEDDARELAMAVPKMVRGFFQGLSESTTSSSSNSKKK